MDRNYMIRLRSDGLCRCSRCGKRQLDLYNMKKHAAFCGFGGKDLPVLEEERSLGYRLEADGNVLVLTVCKPALKPLRGFRDRFRGIEWTPLFEVRFPAGGRRYQVVRNEGGFDMKALLSGIGDGSILPVCSERDADLIRRVFPGVIDVYSPLMFVHIYGGKGFSEKKTISEEAEKSLLARIPDRAACHSPAGEGPLPLYAFLYRYRKNTYVLQVIVPWEGEPLVFVFSGGYAACSRSVSLRELLDRDFYLAEGAEAALRRFDRECPAYLLGQFMERSANVLVPLLAPDYHTGMELAAKAGAAGIAQSMDHLSVMQGDPDRIGSLKKAFGLPPAILRAIDRGQACDALLSKMKEIYACNPAFLQFSAYTPSMTEFYMRADITGGGAEDTFGVRNLTDRQILQILRYLEKHPDDGPYYMDYLSACAQLGEYPDGLTPAVPVREAHDRAVARLGIRQDTAAAGRAFAEAVGEEGYRSLATCFTREDQERYQEEPYLVTVPVSAEDLFREGRDMHNCVRLYIPRVAGKRTRIYFLRKKKEPARSFVTLEVTSDGRDLVQARAFANRRPDVDARRFLRRWCLQKKIRINTCDLR